MGESKPPSPPRALDYGTPARKKFSVLAGVARGLALAGPVIGVRLSLLVFYLLQGTGHEKTAGMLTLIGVPISSLFLGALAADHIDCNEATLRGKPAAVAAIVVSMISALLCFFGVA